MAQTKKEIQEILQAMSGSPRHRFGQNFMIDGNMVRAVAEAGEISSEDVVIEVGPGTGTLTEELLGRAGKVVAVEIDRDLAGMLRERFGGNDRFVLIEGDALAGKHELNAEVMEVISASAKPQAYSQTVKLVANLPYNVASPLVVEMLMAGVELLAFTVQKEVADRLKASAGGDDYGPLTVMVQMLGEVEVLRTLPPQVFWPQPKIDSALVRIRRRDRLGSDARAFGEFVQKLFQARRKTLRKGMEMAIAGRAKAPLDVAQGQQAGEAGAKPQATVEDVLRAVGVDPQIRVENLSPGKLWELFGKSRGE